MASIEKVIMTNGDPTYVVRYRLHSKDRKKSFRKKKDADNFRRTFEADKLRGVVIDPRHGRELFGTYAENWLAQRHDLAQRTRELYRGVLDRHILPEFESHALNAIGPADVRAWNAELADRHPATAAKAYRLLRTIMGTALADEMIGRNPCNIPGASSERPAERPTATVAEVGALADAMPDRMKVAITLAAWCQLRKGELLGLRRRHIDTIGGTLTVSQTRGAGEKGTIIIKGPKSDTPRQVAIPPNVIPQLEKHLINYTGPDPDDYLLTGAEGGPLWPHVLQAKWEKARQSVGRPDLHLHDLRHSGLTWSAASGATTAELMHRAGHTSTAAALRYQHATADRDRALADALGALADSAAPS